MLIMIIQYLKGRQASASQVDESCAVLGYYTASISDFVLTFRDNLSFLSSRIVSLNVT